jgi:preprotein translocase subunit SecG
MPAILHTLILVVHIFLAIGLVGIIVLMQRSEGGLGGLGGGGGGAGGMGGFLSGRSQANVITRTTAFLAAGFFLTSLVLAYGDHRIRGNTTLVPAATTQAPAPAGQAPTAPSGQAPTGQQPEAPTAPASDSGATTPAPAAPAQPAQPAAPSGQ